MKIKLRCQKAGMTIFRSNMEAPYRECPMCWEESVQTDDAVPMAYSTVRTMNNQVIPYFRQQIVECENCHVKLEVNHDGEWDGSWHDLTTIRPLLALSYETDL